MLLWQWPHICIDYSHGCHIWIMPSNWIKAFIELPPLPTPFLISARNIVYTALYHSPNSMTVVSASLGSSSSDLLRSYSGHPPKVVVCTLSSSSRNEVTVCPHRGCVPSGRGSWREGKEHNPWYVLS